MELRLHHIIDHLYNIFLENDGSEICAQLLEEVNKMFGSKYMNDEHDCNVVSMNSLNIHDANDMQSRKLGDAMFDEDDIFSPPSFDEKIYHDIHGTCHHDYNFQSHDSYLVEFASTTIHENKFAYVERDKISFLMYHEKNGLRDGYIVEFIHDATEIIMREEHMLLEIAIISSFISMC